MRGKGVSAIQVLVIAIFVVGFALVGAFLYTFVGIIDSGQEKISGQEDDGLVTPPSSMGEDEDGQETPEIIFDLPDESDDEIPGAVAGGGTDGGEDSSGSDGGSSGLNIGSEFCQGFEDDRAYLWNVDVEVLDVGGKESFRVLDSDGILLRGNFSNEAFYVDNSGGDLDIDYDIIEKCGGVDIVYTISNPTGNAREAPNLKVEGIKQSSDFTKTSYLDLKDFGNMRKISSTGVSGGNAFSGRYPSLYYSPTIVTKDDKFSVGSSVKYPYLDYKNDLNLELKYVDSGTQAGTYSHNYIIEGDYLCCGLPSDNLEIQSQETRTYTLSLRFSSPRYWILTLEPYKKYFVSLYEDDADRREDLRPVLGRIMADPTRINATNERGFFEEESRRVDLLGWGEFVDSFISQANSLGFERTMIWLPSGYYDNETSGENVLPGASVNFPPHFMGEWLPQMTKTELEFAKFAQNDIELGFWWGRSTQIPIPDEWNPGSPGETVLFTSDLDNVTDVEFLRSEIELAADRNADIVGLDFFVAMPDYQRYEWVDEMKQITSDAMFIHEGAGPDFLHSKMGNYYLYFNDNDGQVITGPDILSKYLNDGSEIWVELKGTNIINAKIDDVAQWGYTPLAFTTFTYGDDISGAILEVLDCVDGIDNDGDGYTDWPYDAGCEDEFDNSEQGDAGFSPLVIGEQPSVEFTEFLKAVGIFVLILAALIVTIIILRRKTD